jgi:hypothetical protein
VYAFGINDSSNDKPTTFLPLNSAISRLLLVLLLVQRSRCCSSKLPLSLLCSYHETALILAKNQTSLVSTPSVVGDESNGPCMRSTRIVSTVGRMAVSRLHWFSKVGHSNCRRSRRWIGLPDDKRAHVKVDPVHPRASTEIAYRRLSRALEAWYGGLRLYESMRNS